MPRHPGEQAKNRFQELYGKLGYVVNEIRNCKYDLKEAEKKLQLANKAYEDACNKFGDLKSIINRLADNDGIFPWGLPVSIPIKEFKHHVPEANIPDSDYILEQEYKVKELKARNVSD